MSAAAVRAVSEAVVKAVESARDVGTGGADLKDPADTEDVAKVSVWLYHLSVDEFHRNVPAAAAEVNGRTVRFRVPPLPVNLHYLITPRSKDPAVAQDQLAQVLLALHENPLVVVSDANREVAETVRVSLVPDHLDDKVKLWEALSKPYRLSALVTVRTARLVPAKTDGGGEIGSIDVRGTELPRPRRAGD